MRKVAVAILAFALVILAVVPVVSAQSNRPIRCELWMQLDLMSTPLQWEGTVTGDITGDIVVTEEPPSFPGKTEHFAETFVITTSEGTIEGSDEGVWSFQTFKWRANGMVTTATGDFEGSVGYKVHEIGMTTPVPPPDGETVYAWGTITIVHG